ncbi:hypothetical protein LEP1GSC052_3941 [Leptospira kmetyi serovar Malaysia str. Bejo-Iso9]|nr:hypothetical protein LEP1GSC052_3941 [Leptospira kmetyi serovar Malaysia str. Bejo-Iso9]
MRRFKSLRKSEFDGVPCADTNAEVKNEQRRMENAEICFFIMESSFGFLNQSALVLYKKLIYKIRFLKFDRSKQG